MRFHCVGEYRLKRWMISPSVSTLTISLGLTGLTKWSLPALSRYARPQEKPLSSCLFALVKMSYSTSAFKTASEGSL